MLQLGALLRSACPYTQLSGFLNSITGFSALPLPASVSGDMQAWQIRSYGDIGQLQLEETASPNVVNGNQLLIKVKATGLNPIDLIMIAGYASSVLRLLRWYKTEFPLVVGREFAGTIVSKGTCISDDEFKVGDEVYGVIAIHKQGCQSEYVIADKSHVLLRPQHLSVNEAASVLYASITAWSALYLAGGLASLNVSNINVLVLGASGGVGTVAVQILKSQGATVIGLCSTDAVALVTSLGADFVYDYKDPNHVLEVASHGIYDIILDCADYGYEKLPNDWNYKVFISLNAPLVNNTDKYGIIAGFALSAGQLFTANAPRIFKGKSIRWGFFSPQPSAMTFIDKLIKNKQLKPVIQKVFKFSEVPEAFRRIEAGHLRGKIVIDLQ